MKIKNLKQLNTEKLQELDSVIKNEIHSRKPIPQTVIDTNISKIRSIVSEWPVIENNDDEHLLPGWSFDIDGWREHRFITSYLHTDFGFNNNDDIDDRILCIISDSTEGLWSVDLRTKTAQTVLNYLKPIVGHDVIKSILAYRDEIRFTSEKIENSEKVVYNMETGEWRELDTGITFNDKLLDPDELFGDDE